MEQMKTFTVGADTWEIVDGAAREEITDARTGYDGAEYETIGAAIRGTAANVLENAGEILQDTVTGNTAQSVDDAFAGYPLLSAKLDGKAVQDGTPTPDSPVEVQVVGGRNLLENLISGVYVFSTGLESDSPIYVRSSKVECIPLTDYVMSSASDIGTDCGFLFWDASGTFISSTHPAFTAQAPANAATMAINIRLNGTPIPNITPSDIIEPQLEAGTHSTPYTPYGCIGLQVGETVTPIDLQGHTLASLPDGTRDVLRVDSAGHVSIEQHVGVKHIDNVSWLSSASIAYAPLPGVASMTEAQTISKAICDRFTYSYNPDSYRVSSTNAIFVPGTEFTATDAASASSWFSANETYVYYLLAEPQTIDLGTIEMPEMLQECDLAIYAALEPTFEIEYRQSLNIVISQLKEAIVSLGGTE